MKLSTKGRYALRALVDLGDMLKTGKNSIPLNEIAKRQSISIKYLEAIFIGLKKSGIIKSQRGAFGGYAFNRPVNKITALEVVEAIEGPISIVECCKMEDDCMNSNFCKTSSLWKRVNNGIIQELKNTTIKDLM